jgi:tetratricopeptide (TPR) repeat protein
MQSRRLSSIAAPERRRLMSSGQILGFGLVVAFALVAVYPGQRLERSIQSTVQADSLSLAYLQAWMRAMPDDHSLRLLVARRLLARGDLEEAGLLLQPLLQKESAVLGQFHRDAQLLRLDLLIQKMWQVPMGQPGFDAARQGVRQHLEHLTAYDWDEGTLRMLIREAQSMGASEQAMPFMHSLLEDHPEAAPYVRKEVIALEQAAGNSRAVAALYFQAMADAPSLTGQRENFMAGLRALQAGDLMADVPAAARQYGRLLENDPDTLVFLVRLMRQANRMDMAEYYVARLLQQRTSATMAGEDRP